MGHNRYADVWGEVSAPQTETPIVLLRRYAATLGPKTDNLVMAEVTSKVYRGNFDISFSLVAPLLDGYRHEVFGVRHDAVDIYPVSVHEDRGTESKHIAKANSPEELADIVERVLSRPETHRAIESLLAHSLSAGPEDSVPMP